MESSQDLIVLIHRYVGYPTAFIIAPTALLAFTTPRIHRRFGAIYLGLMVFLYSSGTYLTLTRHSFASWEFARNLTFNFFGFSMVLYAWRAIVLFRNPAIPAPQRLDRALAGVLTVSVVALIGVSLVRDLPMKVFALIGVALVVLEYRELRQGFQPRQMLFRRHLRYVLTSYFYVLTVVSLVHLKEELPRDVKWLWPSALGLAVITLATGGPAAVGISTRGRSLRSAVFATLVTGLLLGTYAINEFLSGAGTAGQVEPAMREGSGQAPVMEPQAERPPGTSLGEPPP